MRTRALLLIAALCAAFIPVAAAASPAANEDTQRTNELTASEWLVRYDWKNSSRLSTHSVDFWKVRDNGTVVPINAEGKNLLKRFPGADRVRLLHP